MPLAAMSYLSFTQRPNLVRRLRDRRRDGNDMGEAQLEKIRKPWFPAFMVVKGCLSNESMLS